MIKLSTGAALCLILVTGAAQAGEAAYYSHINGGYGVPAYYDTWTSGPPLPPLPRVTQSYDETYAPNPYVTHIRIHRTNDPWGHLLIQPQTGRVTNNYPHPARWARR